MESLFLFFFSVSAFAAAPVKTLGYAGAPWSGQCTNLTTAGSQSSRMSFDLDAYPTVKIGVNGSVYTLPLNARTNVNLPSGVSVAVQLEISGDENFIFHTYNSASTGNQEQQLSFTLVDAHHLTMRQDSWTYFGGGTAAGDSYFCKYSR